jgi:uncharacterized membrane protein YgcG
MIWLFFLPLIWSDFCTFLRKFLAEIVKMKKLNLHILIATVSLLFLGGCYTQLNVQKPASERVVYERESDAYSDYYGDEYYDSYADTVEYSDGTVINNYYYYDYPHHRRYYQYYYPSVTIGMHFGSFWYSSWCYDPFYWGWRGYCYYPSYVIYYPSPYYYYPSYFYHSGYWSYRDYNIIKERTREGYRLRNNDGLRGSSTRGSMVASRDNARDNQKRTALDRSRNVDVDAATRTLRGRDETSTRTLRGRDETSTRSGRDSESIRNRSGEERSVSPERRRGETREGVRSGSTERRVEERKPVERRPAERERVTRERRDENKDPNVQRAPQDRSRRVEPQKPSTPPQRVTPPPSSPPQRESAPNRSGGNSGSSGSSGGSRDSGNSGSSSSGDSRRR